MDKEKPDSVKTAGRTLDLFEVFARVRAPLSLSELAHAMDSPLSSTHALVQTMRSRGFVYALDERKMIYPTPRMLMIANLIAENDPLVDLVKPILVSLRDASGETVILGKRQRDHILYLEVVESENTIRYSARPGDSKPLHSSSIGKAMLSLLPDNEIRDFSRTLGRKKVTATTITDPNELVKDITKGRKRKAFITRGENVADVQAVAIPVRVGSEAFGIAIAGPISRMAAKEAECITMLGQASEQFDMLDTAARFT